MRGASRASRARRRINDIALQRIERLLALAESEAMRAKNEDESASDMMRRCNRYVELAMKIGMRYRVRIPKHLKMRICKNCRSYLVPGRNARVRLRKGEYITTTCLSCGAEIRRPYKAPRPPSPRKRQRE